MQKYALLSILRVTWLCMISSPTDHVLKQNFTILSSENTDAQ